MGVRELRVQVALVAVLSQPEDGSDIDVNVERDVDVDVDVDVNFDVVLLG